MHSTIERARKHKKVYTYQEWALLVTMARRNPRTYNDSLLSHIDFYCRISCFNVETNTENETVNWVNIKWLRFEKDQPFKILYELIKETDFMISTGQVVHVIGTWSL